jgi:hypothetical protein
VSTPSGGRLRHEVEISSGAPPGPSAVLAFPNRQRSLRDRASGPVEHFGLLCLSSPPCGGAARSERGHALDGPAEPDLDLHKRRTRQFPCCLGRMEAARPSCSLPVCACGLEANIATGFVSTRPHTGRRRWKNGDQRRNASRVVRNQSKRETAGLPCGRATPDRIPKPCVTRSPCLPKCLPTGPLSRGFERTSTHRSHAWLPVSKQSVCRWHGSGQGPLRDADWRAGRTGGP